MSKRSAPRMPSLRAPLAAGLALALLALFARGGGSALAITYVVDTTADNAALTACTAAPNDCSLRGAVIAANASNIFPDTITLPAGTYFLGGPAGEDAAASGDLDIRSPNIADSVSALLTINGAGAASTIIDAGQSDRVFDMATITRPTNTTALNLKDLTIRNGYPGAANGGALFLATGDTANLTNVIVSDSVSGLSGGGISSSGNVTLNNSTVSGNSAASSGGGIINGQPGHLTINNSTISGNYAGSSGGGGIVNSSVQVPAPQAALTNVTISGNNSTGPGGGIHNSGLGASAVTLKNVTLALNSGTAAAGINNGTSDTATILNSIFANSGSDCTGAVSSQGHNVVQNPGGCAFGGPGDIPGDPLLGSLADNGGPTQTHEVFFGSPAINNGGAGCPSTDQRGAPRVGVCDIGSFEYGSSPGPAPTPTPSPTPTPVPTPTPSPTPTSPPPSGGTAGNVDCSIGGNPVDAVDALKILRWVAGLPVSQNDPCTNPGDPMTSGGNPYIQGDVDCSGIVNAVDALKILRWLAGLPVSLPQGCPVVGSQV